MTKKKTYAAPQLKVHQIKTESVILAGSPTGQSNEQYEYDEEAPKNWFGN